ncbi:MAG: radical SAM protein, partial [Cyanobacteria bacterium K_DeepCast_150m_m2_101]|nr:radical SAM protein [Cyanobacteria bacterium K_DeepCast_150m_m2_101]
VYVGGGTPSLLSLEQLRALLEALRCRYGLAPGAELSLELDPASFDQQRLAGYLAAGITRVSLGGQSFSDAVLESLGRRHRCADLLEAAGWLQQAQRGGRLQSWSLDLIQGLPGQTLSGWQEQLEQAIALQPPHLSVYDLIVEPGTVFERLEQRGALELPESELAADLMELTARTLGAAGYGHYEISNYALPGHASRHNRVYWSGAGWWGFGMGATAAPWGVREARPRTRAGYATWLEEAEQAQRLGDGHLLAVPESGMPLDERWMVGFRRREGVRIDVPDALRRRWQPFVERGLLIEEGPRWRLRDPEGLALSNAVLRELLAWWEEEGSGVADPPPNP